MPGGLRGYKDGDFSVALFLRIRRRGAIGSIVGC